MELGISVFGDASPYPRTGQRISGAQPIRNIQEDAVLTEEVGLDWFGIGEHHTPEFPASGMDWGMDWGGLPPADHLRAIELFGTTVKPLVDAVLGQHTGAAAPHKLSAAG
jgi:hypothetical protein